MRKFPYFRDARKIKGFRGTLDMVWGRVGADVVHGITAHYLIADVRVFRKAAVVGDMDDGHVAV